MSAITNFVKLWYKCSLNSYKYLAKIVSYPFRHLIKSHKAKMPDIVLTDYSNERDEIALDYRRIGKDFYKALDKYEQSR